MVYVTIQDIHSQVVDPPKDCSDFIDLVVKLDHCLRERKGERSKGNHPEL